MYEADDARLFGEKKGTGKRKSRKRPSSRSSSRRGSMSASGQKLLKGKLRIGAETGNFESNQAYENMDVID